MHRLALPVQTPEMATRFLLAAATLVALSWPAVAVAKPASTTILSIGDGDTIRVRQAGKAITVRLACVDAPETAQTPYGQQARSYLQQRLPVGREVRLEVKTTDRYGRSVAEVISEININLAMVEDGQAFSYRQYLGGCNAKEYLDAEYRASRRRYGVWQVPGGITRPWDFRRSRSSATIPDGRTPDGRRYLCKEIGSYARAQELLARGIANWIATVMGKPANPCSDWSSDWSSGGTGIGPSASLHQGPEGVL
jgi:endonuclease YncB( thermonuclease family)